MASSNKHWPSMFKSKPCNTTTAHHHQWQHDVINPSSSLLSSGFPHRTPYAAGNLLKNYSSHLPGCEERTPEPKPRWNPKPEQIRILESIFNSGMVNPPRDEIRKIRAQLQEFGQVGDANVFYWFQNRKSRSKHKQQQRHLQTTTGTSNKQPQQQQNSPTTNSATTTTAPSSSSSSSDKSSPTKSVNQTYFQINTPPEISPAPQPFCFQTTNNTGGSIFMSQGGFGFSAEMSGSLGGQGGGGGGDENQTDGSCSGMLLSELMMMKKVVEDEKLMSYNSTVSANTTPPPPNPISTCATGAANHAFHPSTTTTAAAAAVSVPSIISQILGAGVAEPAAAVGPAAKSTVFINDVAFEVAVGPFSVREAFGDDAVLVHSSGHPVLTNEWGVTLQSLHHGGFYYLVRTLTPISSTASENTTHMVQSTS
ncbi:hypothetical protein RHGRI_037643 [Rhododendron griersonianum]|uniref:Protein WUSCHEL n=1 Tax=Rhododendron griersonianum TaxID=479676 RepID=A0AAV6HXY0_9ERIC|nr:hypothetical protein RHGRI_037643 [Rhododendron griersonianum]